MFQSRHRESCQLAILSLVHTATDVDLFQSRHRESCQLAGTDYEDSGDVIMYCFNRAIANPAS